METLTSLRLAARRAAERRRRTRQLSEELAGYRTASERAELAALCARHDTTPDELLRNVA